MRDRHELDRTARVLQATVQVGHVELTGLVVVDNLDHRADATRYLQERDDVAGVLRVRSQDPLAGLERHRVEGHVPGPRGILDDRDLLRPAADQLRNRGVRTLDGIRTFAAAS